MRYSVIVWALLSLVSCSVREQKIRGFVNEPQDSIFVDLKDYVFPASDIWVREAVKCGEHYFFMFRETSQSKHSSYTQSFIISVSKESLQTKQIPLPDKQDYSSFCMGTQDTLVVKQIDGRHFSLDTATWEWSPYLSKNDDLMYEDNDWRVMTSSHGEFGLVTWFIDKHSQEEYAFLELNGDVHRIGKTFYVVNRTRIYELDDPSRGFLCDSLTCYKKAKDIRLIHAHFCYAGYHALNHNFLPIVYLDNESAEVEKSTFGGRTVYSGGFWTSDSAKADTTIIDSYIAADTLFCVLNTPTGLELAKLHDGNITPVHDFNKQVYNYSWIHPHITFTSKYRDSGSSDEKMLILIESETGVYELLDIEQQGNSFLKIQFDSGVTPVNNDGFEELLSFYIEDWKALSLDKVLQFEKDLGGEMSDRYTSDRNGLFLGDKYLEVNKSIQKFMVTKLIENDCQVDSQYSVYESDTCIKGIVISWTRLHSKSEFNSKSKYNELCGIITTAIGRPIKTVPKTRHEIGYSEWHCGDGTIKLYIYTDMVRFVMY